MANINENNDSGHHNINRGISTESLTLLTPLDKAIILKHLQLAGELKKWYNIRDFLIVEMHKKKCEFKRTLYHPIDMQAKPYYYYILIDNTEGNFTDNPFPGEFRSELEEVMFSELSKESKIDNVKKIVNLLSIYYGHDDKDDDIKFDSFDQNDWNLKNCTEWTLEDRDKLNLFKDGFLMAMDKWISIIELKRGKAKSLKCRKIYNRYQKRFEKVI